MRPKTITYANSNRLRHFPELDGIRGIAILLVLFYHLFWFTSPGASWSGIPWCLWKVSQIGWVGVNLFFVLSGFLITRILIHQKGQVQYFQRFYFRRALRILPLFILTLIFIYFHYENSGPFVWLNIFFLANVPSFFGVVSCYPGLWSLSMEEQFYLIWPQLVKRITLRTLGCVACGICLLSPCLRAFTFLGPALAPIANFLGGFDGFAYGAILVLACESSQFSEQSLKKYSIWCVLLAIVFLVFGFKFGITTRQRLIGEMFLPSIIYLITSALIGLSLSKSGSKRFKILSRGFLPHWGKLSYAAYLSHHPIPEVVNKIFSWYPQIYSYYFSFGFACLQFGLALLGTYIVSWFLHRYIELPFLKLKNKNTILFETAIHPQY